MADPRAVRVRANRRHQLGRQRGVAVWVTKEAPNRAPLYGVAVQTADNSEFKSPVPLWFYGSSPTFVSWSPTGDRMVAAVDADIAHLLDPQTGFDTLLNHPGLKSAGWSPDGTLLATGAADGSVRIWRAQSGAPEKGPVERVGGAVFALAWSGDQTRLAVGGSNKSVTVLDTRSWRRIGPLTPVSTPIHSLQWSPDGKRLAAGDERDARIWTWTGDLLTEAGRVEHGAWVGSVAWNADSTRLATGSWDQTVRISDENGNPVGSPLTHLKPVGAIAWNHDGSLVTSAWEHVSVWGAGGENSAVATLVHNGPVTSLAWNADGRLATGSWDGTIRIWRREADSWQVSHKSAMAPIDRLEWSPDQRRVAAAGGTSVTVWDGLSELESKSFDAPVTSASWSPDGTQLAVASGKRVSLWSPRSQHPVTTLEVESTVTAVAWSRHKRLAAASSIGAIKVWDMEKDPSRPWTKSHGGVVVTLAWSPDGSRLATGGWSATARIWDAVSGEPAVPPLQQIDAVSSVAWNHDGSRLLTGSWSGRAQVWNAADGRAVAPEMRENRAVVAIAWEHSGERIATGTVDGRVQLWSARTGLQVSLPMLHGLPVQALDWNRDDTMLATGSCDGTVALWNVPTGRSGDSTALADAIDALSMASLEADAPQRTDAKTGVATYERLRATILSDQTPLSILLKPLIVRRPPTLVTDERLPAEQERDLRRELDHGVRPAVKRNTFESDGETIPHCNALVLLGRSELNAKH